jgi:hypothetical protein
MPDIGATIEKWGGIAVAAFGDKILVGVVMEMLSEVKPSDILDCISHNKTIAMIAESDWKKYAGFAEKAQLKYIDMEKFLALLHRQIKRHRPDLFGMIDNTPEGWVWLNSQITAIKSKLGV